MLQAVGELEPRFRKSGQQQLLIETMLVRFALLDRGRIRFSGTAEEVRGTRDELMQEFLRAAF